VTISQQEEMGRERGQPAIDGEGRQAVREEIADMGTARREGAKPVLAGMKGNPPKTR